ncbi:MAG: diacylglycerol kinase family lipid kinase [Thermoanaerobaculia bacterium]|nr:diacylglycerol kinase family lipid kinase [Thermoanaerobaculia bacterium]
MKLKLIYNPYAGRGRALRHAAEIERYLRQRGAEVDVHASSSSDDLTRLAAEGSRGVYDRVVVCGGDGSLNLAIRDFDLERGTLALIPQGSGDDFAKVNRLPRGLREACDVALSGRVREVDVALANGIRYVGVAGLGFDSEVAAFANRNVRFLRGSAVYLYAILRVLPSFVPHRVTITRDGEVRSEEMMFAVVGSSSRYGGGIRIVPEAVIDDGILDYCIVHRTSRVQLLKTLPRAYNGTHVRSSFVETGRGMKFRFESERPLEVYADGERVTSTPVDFGLETQKLRFVVPL